MLDNRRPTDPRRPTTSKLQAAPVPSGKPADKRTSPRVELEVEVSMHTEDNFYTGMSENLSEGGLFIATYQVLSVGTDLDIILTLPGLPPIKAAGTVRWVRDSNQFTSDVSPGLGVQFTKLDAQDRTFIEAFLKTRAPLLYET